MFDRANFFTVQSHEVDDYASHLSPLLDAMRAYTDQVSADDVLIQAKSGDAQLWAYAEGGVVKAVAATRVHTMAKGRLCTIWVAVGFDKLDIFQEAHDEIEAWAREIGCYAIEIVGREGWQRVLTDYKRTAVVLEKPLQQVH